MFRFGEFELDPGAYELRRGGTPVRLERRPMELLLLLVERQGQLVTREDIGDRLWGRDVFVDVETGVNTAIRKVRQALGEQASAVVTIPGKGYRFSAAVEAVERLERVTIAVLAFENLTGDPARDYLADGFTEEAITVAGQIAPERLVVVGRTAVMRFKGSGRSPADLARELRAQYIVESSIRAEGGRLRVTSRLVRAADQAQVWAATFDSAPASVLEFERELCATLAEQIRLRLAPGTIASLARRHSRDEEAYNLYLQGRYFWNQLTPETTRRAVECFNRATARDPGYALAWSGIADAHAASPITGDTDPRVVGPVAEAAARRAVDLDPQLAAAHTSMGSSAFFITWRWREAEAHHRRALEIDPQYAHGHRMLGILLSHLGRCEEALAEIRRARELDPLAVMHHALASQIAFACSDYPLAIQFAQQAIAIDPVFWIGRWFLAQALERLGDVDEALAAAEHATRLSGNSKPVSLRGFALARAGRTVEARQVLATLEAISRERYVPPYAIALVHLGLGDTDDALAWLERALAVRDVHLMFLTVDSKWDPLRADPRFAQIRSMCGFDGRDNAVESA